MAKFGRKPVSDIVGDENLSAEEKVERIFALYGQALDEGYISKSAAQAAQAAAIEQARQDALKGVEKPNIKESEEYKALMTEYDGYKAMQKARSSEDFSAVKPKFFETVYGMIDRTEGAKPVKDQLTEIQGKYEEYFATEPERKPTFGAATQGSVPSGQKGPSFGDAWGFAKK
jgi:hypothetical protein